jgi:predicted alpha/beta-hydrolase family hydrolase
VSAREIDTPYGPARAIVVPGQSARGALILGHGAGGGVEAPDLIAAANAAAACGFTVVRVEQPYRVAGRRTPAPAPQLDTAWLAVVERLRTDELAELPCVVGGRSSGGRVACRTAAAAGAVGVLCLAFPLQPPGRPGAPSRLPELEAVGVPVLIVQGDRDPFGAPPEAPGRRVVRVPGDHGLKRDPGTVAAAVAGWLREVSDAVDRA